MIFSNTFKLYGWLLMRNTPHTPVLGSCFGGKHAKISSLKPIHCSYLALALTQCLCLAVK